MIEDMIQPIQVDKSLKFVHVKVGKNSKLRPNKPFLASYLRVFFHQSMPYGSSSLHQHHAKDEETFFANRLKRVRAMITLKTTTATDVPIPKAYLQGRKAV